MNNPFSTYAKLAAALAVTALLAVGLVNYLVDPYGIYPATPLRPAAWERPEIGTHARIHKSYAALRERPEILIIGTSRASALDENHPGFKGAKTLKLNLPASNVAELYRFVKHSNRDGRVKMIVFGADFFAFNAYLPPTPDFDEALLATDEDAWVDRSRIEKGLELLFSMPSLRSSLTTLKANRNTLLNAGGSEPTQRPPDGPPVVGGRRGDFHQAPDIPGTAIGLEAPSSPKPQPAHYLKFIQSEAHFINRVYFPEPYKRFSFEQRGGRASSLEAYRQLLAYCHARNIDLRIYLSPSHARQWELISAAGLWDTFEEWKRHLVAINAEEARFAREAEFPLWDFTGYDAITTEPLPSFAQENLEMTYFVESAHYKPLTAKLILDRVLDASHPATGWTGIRFGARINSADLADHLAEIRARRKAYVAARPADVTDIRTLALYSDPVGTAIRGEAERLFSEGRYRDSYLKIASFLTPNSLWLEKLKANLRVEFQTDGEAPHAAPQIAFGGSRFRITLRSVPASARLRLAFHPVERFRLERLRIFDTHRERAITDEILLESKGLAFDRDGDFSVEALLPELVLTFPETLDHEIVLTASFVRRYPSLMGKLAPYSARIIPQLSSAQKAKAAEILRAGGLETLSRVHSEERPS